MPRLKKNFSQKLSSCSTQLSFRRWWFRSAVILYKEKDPCKSSIKHSHKALLFTYRKKLTPFMQRKKGWILLYQTYAFFLARDTYFNTIAPLNFCTISVIIFYTYDITKYTYIFKFCICGKQISSSFSIQILVRLQI